MSGQVLPRLDFTSTSKLDTALVLQDLASTSLSKPILNDAIRKYPDALVVRKSGTIVGILFFERFFKNAENYLYFGPAFFADRYAFLVAVIALMLRQVVSFRRLHCMAEIQNPAVAMHWYKILPVNNVSPSFPEFNIRPAHREVLKTFSDQIYHISNADIDRFKSHSSISLYREREKSDFINWLADNGICLAEKQNMLMVATIKFSDFPSMLRKLMSWQRESQQGLNNSFSVKPALNQ